MDKREALSDGVTCERCAYLNRRIHSTKFAKLSLAGNQPIQRVFFQIAHYNLLGDSRLLCSVKYLMIL